MVHRTERRRGVVILVVLSLLVLFVLLAVTFAIVAGQYNRAATAQARVELLGDPPQKQLDGALYQLLRDTYVPGSVIHGHSLLRDMYGEDGFYGKTVSASLLPGTGYQFVDITVDSTTLRKADTPPTSNPDYTLSAVAGNYSGCVMTMVSGKASGNSTRIVGYKPDPAAGTYTFRVMAFKRDDNTTVAAAELGGVEFVVNGRPFNGTGVGWNGSTMVDSPLKPNYIAATPVNTGGSDECYDAPDFQNLHLGLNVPEQWYPGNDGKWGVANYDDNGNGQVDDASEAGSPGSDDWRPPVHIPSFHRPALVKYWIDRNQFSSLRSQVVLRPEEPNFDGSNSSFNRNDPNWYVNGPWDVDNDGDGVPDSVWIDLGFPVQTAPDGRRYKPLFAILCEDMDGRLNVNVHDRLASLLPASQPAPQALIGTTTAVMPRGQGYGPAEISLAGVYPTSLAALLSTRYGGNGPGVPGQDALTLTRLFNYPPNYFSGSGWVFRSPPDLQGELRMGLNAAGQPVYENYAIGMVDSPYEFNVSLDRPGDRSFDAPFTPAELERLLRQNDLDSKMLPSRLLQIPSVSGAQHLVTTDSHDLPVPFGSLLQTLAARLATNVPQGEDPVTWVNKQLSWMVSVDLILGTRMDINRPFGDGRDNNSNGAIDDPSEAPSEMLAANIPFNHYNYMPIGNERYLARQQFARHLYVLASALCNPNSSATVAKQLAQWAVNVVDFRDPDAIMTPFEYDPNPFDGWGVDDVVNGYLNGTSADDNFDNIVWGCERPELLISESLAFHARRTEDRDDDATGKRAVDEDDGTKDFDQRLRPYGAAFIELYNPWRGTDMQTTPPGELYTNGGVQLNKLDAATNRHPVWRMLIVHAKTRDGQQNTAFSENPDGGWDPNDNRMPGYGRDAQRAVYFTTQAPSYANPPKDPANPSVPPDHRHGERKFYTSSAVPIVVAPGNYAVIGPTGLLGYGFTTIGRRQDALDERQAQEGNNTTPPPPNPLTADLKISDTHRIVFDTTQNLVQVYSGTDVFTSNRAVTIPIDRSDLPNQGQDKLPMELSVSEPLDGYPFTVDGMTWVGPPAPQTPPPAVFTDEGEYEQAPGTRRGSVDQPLDAKVGYSEVATTNGTLPSFCVIHLQRLADPTQPWHVTGNPYRTVDSSLVDLTVFNGVTSDSETNYGVSNQETYWCWERGEDELKYDPFNPSLPPSTATDPHPNALMEPSRFLDGRPVTKRRLWRQTLLADRKYTSLPSLMTASELPGAGHYFNRLLTRSLGGLNYWYSNPNWEPALGSVFANLPFPWLTWNDRPYVSQYELMQVPATSSYELLRRYDFDPNLEYQNGEFSPPLPARPTPGLDANDPAYPATAPPFWPYPLPIPFPHPSPKARPDAWPYDKSGSTTSQAGIESPQFGHLLNFFYADTDSHNLHQLFEYVHVPSRFNGAETIFNPAVFQQGPGQNTDFFYPPFNRLPNYREPGRVNLNTMMNPVVWEGVLNGFPGPSFYDLAASRRGFSNLVIDGEYPTFFANPFRAPGTSQFVPPLVSTKSLVATDVDTTLLRTRTWTHVYTPYNHHNPADLTDDTPIIDPATMRPRQYMQERRGMLFQSSSTRFADDAQRNSYFRYQNLHRLGNLLTIRSNVYAIWITVGYFEAEPVTPDTTLHPDGFRVAQELGLDSGEARRHRAFYFVDRTIPVAFQPGQNHNVDKCVLLRRFIE